MDPLTTNTFRLPEEALPPLAYVEPEKPSAAPAAGWDMSGYTLQPLSPTASEKAAAEEALGELGPNEPIVSHHACLPFSSCLLVKPPALFLARALLPKAASPCILAVICLQCCSALTSHEAGCKRRRSGFGAQGGKMWTSFPEGPRPDAPPISELEMPATPTGPALHRTSAFLLALAVFDAGSCAFRHRKACEASVAASAATVPRGGRAVTQWQVFHRLEHQLCGQQARSPKPWNASTWPFVLTVQGRGGCGWRRSGGVMWWGARSSRPAPWARSSAPTPSPRSTSKLCSGASPTRLLASPAACISLLPYSTDLPKHLPR